MPDNFKVILYLIMGISYLILRQYKKNEVREQKSSPHKKKRPASWRDLLEETKEKNKPPTAQKKNTQHKKIFSIPSIPIKNIQSPSPGISTPIKQKKNNTVKKKFSDQCLKKSMVIHEILNSCKGL